MFNYLCESGRCYALPSLPAIAAIAASAAANAAVMIAAAVVTRPPTTVTTSPEVVTREVVYLLPLPPQRTPFEQVDLDWSGGDGLSAGMLKVDSAAGLYAAGEGGKGKGTGVSRKQREQKRPALDSTLQFGEFDGSNFYIASELDRPVEFDPTSGGPAYPPELQQAGVEGWATVQFVVDTTGAADLHTIKEVDVTHPQFAAAVREALPKMHFRPAELGDRHVPQLVEQQFKFVITMAAMAPADSQPSPVPQPPAPQAPLP